jgi:hypothetical protein
MATEAAILDAAGGESADARDKIRLMLDAVDRLDNAGEPYRGAAAALDGFFVRDDVTGPADSRLGGRFARCDSDWQAPNEENASPSGDQIFGLMFGLAAVNRFVADATLRTRAGAISDRLYGYAKRNRFVLRLPDGGATRRGSDMRWLSSLLHGLNLDITGIDRFGDSEIEVAGLTLPLTGVAAFWDDPISARQIGDLAGRTVFIPIINESVELNSFALHLLLTAIAPGDVWNQQEIETVAMKVQHHLSVLLHCLRHPGRLPTAFDRREVQRILDDCPETGPAESLDPALGWNNDNRWIRSGGLGLPAGGGPALYNGLDWLALHNLVQLVFIGPR